MQKASVTNAFALQYSFCCNHAKVSNSIIHTSIYNRKEIQPLSSKRTKIKLYVGGGPEEHTHIY